MAPVSAAMLSSHQTVATFDYKPLIDDAFRQSLSEFAKNLDMACASLSGMNAEEQSIGEEMYVIRSHVVDEIATVLATTGAMTEDVVNSCVRIREQHANLDILSQKRRTQASLDGVNMLALVAACYARVEEMTALLYKKLDVIKATCLTPPDALIKSMKNHGLNYSVLSVIAHSGSDPDKTAFIVAQYFTTNSVAVKLHNACIEALRDMHNDLACDVRSTRWSNIHVDLTEKSSDGSRFECTIEAPPHLPQVPSVRLASSNSGTSCTRVARFLDALEQCARLGVFIPNALDFRYVTKLADNNNMTSSSWQSPREEDIPHELKRDFCILLAVERLLPRGKGTLHPVSVAECVMTPGSSMRSECTTRSMEQAVNHVVRKCVLKIKNQVGLVCGIEYVKNPNHNYSIGHLELDASGSARLRVHVRRLLTSMATNPNCLKTEWRATRSSRKMASRK